MQALLSGRSYGELLAGAFSCSVALTLLGLALGYAVEAWAQKRGRTVFAVPMKRGQLRKEVIGTAVFHLVFAPAAAVLLFFEWITFDGRGWLSITLSAAVPWLAFQVYYYFFHRSLHHRALFFMHRWHHESLVTTPMTGFSMHPLEAVGWTAGLLVPLVLLSAADLLHAGGFFFFLTNFWIGNIAGHANADIFPMRATYAGAAFVPPVLYHSLHHARFDGHYGFAAAYMDRLLGTEWPDWKELHDRVYDGRPLTTLKARGEAATPSPSAAPGP